MTTQAMFTTRQTLPGQSANTASMRAGSLITTATQKLPNRYILHAVEGWGKTSFGAQFPKPVFLQSRGETGLETLIDCGLLAPIPHTPEITKWVDALYTLEYLLTEKHDYGTLVVDTLNGLEKLCFEAVCERDFGGKTEGFLAYGKGPLHAMNDWRELLSGCDALRAQKRMRILFLCHTKIQTFNNPLGANYDRFIPEVSKETWSLTAKWSDCIFFGNFESTVIGGAVSDTAAKNRKGKGVGAGNQRDMHVQRHDAFDAKNRLGLTESIDMGSRPREGYANFIAAIKAANAANTAPEPTTATAAATESTTNEPTETKETANV